MLSRTVVRRGYEKWPWPMRMPLKQDWATHLNTSNSTSRDVRNMAVLGDVAVVGTLLFAGFRAYHHYTSGAYEGRLRHLNGTAPYIVAQEADFTKPLAGARVVPRAQLDAYMADAASARKTLTPVEEIIFKY
jgi:hypothetical protein